MQLRTGSKTHPEQTQSLNTITITCHSTGFLKILVWGAVKQSKVCFPQGRGQVMPPAPPYWVTHSHRDPSQLWLSLFDDLPSPSPVHSCTAATTKMGLQPPGNHASAESSKATLPPTGTYQQLVQGGGHSPMPAPAAEPLRPAALRPPA